MSTTVFKPQFLQKPTNNAAVGQRYGVIRQVTITGGQPATTTTIYTKPPGKKVRLLVWYIGAMSQNDADAELSLVIDGARVMEYRNVRTDAPRTPGAIINLTYETGIEFNTSIAIRQALDNFNTQTSVIVVEEDYNF